MKGLGKAPVQEKGMARAIATLKNSECSTEENSQSLAELRVEA